MHRRKAMRDAVVTALRANAGVSALVPATSHIESSRIVPLDPAALPRIMVYIRGEKVSDLITRAPREYLVQSDLVVEYVSRIKPASSTPEDELDAAAEAIEVAMEALEASDLGNLVRDMNYQGTDVSIELQGQQATIAMQLRYQVELGFVVEPVLLDDFETNAIGYLVGDAPADNPADVVTLPIV